jgi:transglutaminase-like putative cysteine protease
MKYFFLALLFWPLCSSGQLGNVKIAPAPSWVKKIDYPNSVSDTSMASGGYYDLLTEEQFNQSTQEAFSRYAQLVLSEKGLGNVTPISISFDPSFQELAFHNITIIRNGKKLERLRLSDIEVLRREQNLERAVYDGDLTAICNLQDIQVGDILEYSFTIKGSNPVFQNKYFRNYYFNYGVPIKKIFYRLLSPSNKPLYLKKFNQAPEALINKQGTITEYEWTLQDVPSLTMEESTPSWYNPYTYVQVSEFNEWKEVAQWAHSLFNLTPSQKLSGQVPGLTSDQSLEEKIKKSIQFIQDEVRYLSFADGIHGFKPHQPQKIITQRFGDCKDKSLLLATILNELGVKSRPVLINTSYGATLSEVLPSPRMFDHCIVQFQWQDSTYWIDPTISFQRGPLKKIFLPNYTFGLVIDPNTSGLEPIPTITKAGSVKISDVFDVHSIGGGATLQVSTVYSGNEADYMREYFKSNSLTEIDERYLNFYATDYPDIELGAPIKYVDDEIFNHLTTTENYEISSFWEFDSLNHIHRAAVYPRNLASYLATPTTKIRRMPYAIAYPLDISYDTKLNMPEDWSVTEAEKTIESSGFIYKSRISLKNSNEVHLNLSYKTKKRYLEKDEVKDYIKKVNDVTNDMSFTLTYKDEMKTNSTFNTPFLLIVLMLFIPGFFILKKIYEYDPEPKSTTQFHSIGGWLILPAIGLCLTPLRMGYELINIEYFNYSNWRILTDPDFSAYNVGLGSFILMELIFNMAFLFFSVVLLILFFKRRSSVPLLAALFYGLNFLFLLLDGIVGAQLQTHHILKLGSLPAAYLHFIATS